MRRRDTFRPLSLGALLVLLTVLLACEVTTGPQPVRPEPEPEPEHVATQLELTPGDLSLRIGESRSIEAAFLDAEGRPVDAPGALAWASSAPEVLTVDSTGTVLGLAPGSAQVTATAAGLNGEAAVRVVLPAPQPDSSTASEATIGAEGGTVTTTASDGTRYTLRIPADALDSPTEITLTPLGRLDDLPLTGGVAGSVDFAPDGLRFLVPAELEIVTTGPTSAVGLVGFSLDTDAFRLKPIRLSGDTLRIRISHFSGAGAARGTPEEIRTAAALPGTAEEEAEAALAVILAKAADDDESPDPEQMAETLRRWYWGTVSSRLSEANAGEYPVAMALAEFLRWWADAQLVADGHLEAEIAAGRSAVAAMFREEIRRLNTRCLANNDPAPIVDILHWAGVAQTLGMDEPGSGLDLETVMAGLCQQIVIDVATLPETIVAGTSATLEVVAGLVIGEYPPTFTRSFAIVVDDDESADVTPAAGISDEAGRFTATVTPAPGARFVSLQIEATLPDLPLPPGRRQAVARVREPVRVAITPALDTLEVGSTATFNATVSGTEDQRVEWSATGGEITPDGVYTAGTIPGTYEVRATSLADSTVVGTAEVVVAAPTVVRAIESWEPSGSFTSIGGISDPYLGSLILTGADALESFDIELVDSLRLARLKADYDYDPQSGSLRQLRVQSRTARAYDQGTVRFRVLLGIEGEHPVDIGITGVCSTPEDWRPNSVRALGIEFVDEPTSGGSPTPEDALAITCEEDTVVSTSWRLQPGEVYYVSVLRRMPLDMTYDLTFTFQTAPAE